jgi:prepilin-type N-terminal cleavage/methylation domain-containing protein
MNEHRPHRVNKAFTLVEILLVVLIIGILAAIIVPRFSNATQLAREAMLADNLRMLRMQMTVFRSQHLGVSPGYPGCDEAQAPTENVLMAYLTRASDKEGNLADPGTAGFRYGPYMSTMLANPVNGKSSVQIIGDDEEFPAAADDSTGYIYQPSTLTLKAGNPGTDQSGKSFWDY